MLSSFLAMLLPSGLCDSSVQFVGAVVQSLAECVTAAVREHSGFGVIPPLRRKGGNRLTMRAQVVDEFALVDFFQPVRVAVNVEHVDVSALYRGVVARVVGIRIEPAHQPQHFGQPTTSGGGGHEVAPSIFASL